MKKWYIKSDKNNIILDITEYPYDGYIEVELSDTSLPAGINGGWFTWTGINYVEDLSKKTIPEATEIQINTNSIGELGKTVAQEKIKNMQKDATISQLGQELSKIKLDMMILRGGK